MRLETLTLKDCQTVRVWRNESLETLRTARRLSVEEQCRFYQEVVSNPHSPHRYWAIYTDVPDLPGVLDGARFLGMGGLTYISWENRLAEISLILDPDLRGQGLGEKAVDLLLEEGFARMGLKTVCGECYHCNTAGADFWEKITERYGGTLATLPNRKFWKGRFWGSMYFSIDAEDWRKVHGTA
jgi:RimJ/RimL family protein N-acetyltransferase